jgi:hypothetical protein
LKVGGDDRLAPAILLALNAVLFRIRSGCDRNIAPISADVSLDFLQTLQ